MAIPQLQTIPRRRQTQPILEAPKAQAVIASPAIGYYVGKHSRPLSDYPLWARWLIRAVYFWTGYQVTAEAVGICTDEEAANELCLDGSYFYKPLYVNIGLPPEPCSLGPVVWPRSEAKNLYAKCSPDTVSMTRKDFNLLASAIGTTVEKAVRSRA